MRALNTGLGGERIIAARFCLLALAFYTMAGHAQTVTLNSLLREMVDRDAIAEYPSPEFKQLQGSTYNRASYAWNQPDQTFSGWFADGDGGYYLRTETNSAGATEYVLMEHTGPGAITKLWTPYFYQGLNNNVGTRIRIYLDGSTIPVLDENLIELVTRLEWNPAVYGPVPPSENHLSVPHPLAAFTARAGDCYLPIPFASSCKVTLSSAPFYDIVMYRCYDPGAVVETFTTNSYYSATNQAQLALTAQALASPSNYTGGRLFATNGTLAPGQAFTLDLNPGPAAVRDWEIQLDPNQIATNAPALRSTVVIMNFDGEQSVWCPIGDFFCSADSIHPFNTWTRTSTTNGLMVCRWVIPYQSTGSITLTNLGTNAVSATLTARTGPWNWDANSMHFHANWRPDDVEYGASPVDWNFIIAHGRGVLVGDAWTVCNIQGGWWGEGDEKIYVDGEYETNFFPGIFGTGTEDYYGWAGGVNPTRADEFSVPFLSNVRVGGLDGGTLGYNINTRIRQLDAVPFKSELNFYMESSFGTGIRNPWDVLSYAAPIFWYAIPGATDNRPPMPAQAAQPIISMSQLQAIQNRILYGSNPLTGTAAASKWNLGEQDPGAMVGATGSATTKDVYSGNDLAKFGSPVYSVTVPPGGSTLSMSFNGADSYYQDSGPNLAGYYQGVNFNQFSLAYDVYPTALGGVGFSFPVSIGGNAGGLAVVEIGGAWHLIHQGVAESSAGPAVALNAWTHLELQRRDFGSGVETRLFINGSTNAACTIVGAPSPPVSCFTIGANQMGGSAVEGYFNGLVDNVLLQNLNPVVVSGPTISPNFGSVPEGGVFSLAVVASGEPALNYIWRDNGVVVTNSGGAASVTFANAAIGQSGNYDVVVTNAYGSITSDVVAVTVVRADNPPSIANPLSVSPATSVTAGSTFTLTASGVSGSGPLTYLWRRNGTVVSNTAPVGSVTFADASTNQAGRYDVVITNAFGSATSSAVIIDVTLAPRAEPAVKAWYRLGEADVNAFAGNPANAITMDEVGTNNLGRLGSPTYSADVWTNGGRLSVSLHSSTGDWFTGGNLPIFNTLNLSNLSVSFDAKPTIAGSYNIPVCLGQYGNGCCFIYMSGGTWHYHVNGAGDQISGGTAALNQWQHVAFVRTNGVNSLFVNGVQVGATNNTLFPAVSAEFSLGAALNDSGNPDGLFDGLIDNVIISDLSISVPLIPPVLNLKVLPGQVRVVVTGASGYLHTLWRTPDLSPTSWVPVMDRVTSLDGRALLIDHLPPVAGAFYRVTAQ